MQYQHQPHVAADIAKRSQKNIESVNQYIDGLRGTVITVQSIRFGQQGAYQDHIYEALIFCHQPNSLTTNAPTARYISQKDAEALARIFVHEWDDPPKPFGPRLEFLRPVSSDYILGEGIPDPFDKMSAIGKSAAWHVQIRMEYTG